MRLPYDIKQECLWIVRGYERRVKNYAQERNNILHGSSCECDGMPNGTDKKSPTERKIAALELLESCPEVQRVHAVDHAKMKIGRDVASPECRERLKRAILLNCVSGREYPFERLNVNEFSRRDFYRRKDGFLEEIAKYMGLV